ncbi:MAG TPA: protein kinase [Candidatus Binatia bacterium]|jgi:serine/threonine protein phosphatase PrpC|nr:protein kinase [Candidatus Binatia bacterium]
MKVKCHQLSCAGSVREHNEDFLLFWEPEDFEMTQKSGSLAVLADGVGGEGNGEIASRMAAETALAIFKEAKPETPANDLVRNMFDTAAAKVFQAAQNNGRMATTLLASVFRHDKVTIAHVGDSRAYLIRAGRIKRLTSDHSYTALQVKLGLLLERQAMTSPHRSTLTRSIGYEPMCHYDITTEPLTQGDVILQCTDGLYGFLLDDEILEAVVKYHPGEACKRLIALAEKRQVSDNVSVQIVQVWDVDRSKTANPGATRMTGSGGHDLNVGAVLDDRFEITDIIAKSGMASLFKAKDRKTGAAVAVKVPYLQIESDPAGFDRFRREEEIGLQLDHPYILKFIPVEKKSRPYIVMEYLEGQTLSELLKNVRPLPEPDAVKIASRICEALEYMHQKGVVHRDLKPQNIMLCNDGTIRIMDFGIARSQQSRRLTFVGFTPAMGTPDYMAPEQVRGSRGDQRTDIYSLGAILYEMATGETPFGGDSAYVIMNARVTGDPVAPRKVNPKITPVLEEIILHAMERDPKRRYQSAAEMKRELDNYELVEMTNRYTRLQAPQIWKSRFRMVPMIIAFVLLQVILFLLLMLYFKKK